MQLKLKTIATTVALGVTLPLSPTIARADDFTTIPVIVNILKNAGITKEEAKKAIEEANKILKPAKMKLTISGEIKTDVMDIDGDGTNEDGDGILTREERDKIRAAGGKELKKTLKNEKGKKIVFAKQPDKDNDKVDGVSVHRNPTIIIQGGGRTTEQRRSLIVHEMFHNLTLSEKHQVQDTDPKFSDEDGHTPGIPDNVMHPTNYGTKITKLQVKKIRDDKQLEKESKHVTQETRTSAGVKRQQQFGTGPDSLADQSGTSLAHFDLLQTTISSEFERDTVNVLMTLGGLFPSTGAVDAFYSLLWDTDANSSTGISRGGFLGMEREVRLQVLGDASLEPLMVTGEVIDLINGTSTMLSDPIFLAEAKEMLDRSGLPHLPHENQFIFDIPKSLLNFSASEMPVGVLAEDTSSIYDTASFLFDSERWLKDATLSLFQGVANSGELVPFSISGLTPNDPFNFFIDDQLLFSDVLDSSGGFSGNFEFPSGLSDDFYFLTAQDSTGEFAFNKIHPNVPEPGTVLGLLAVGGLGLGLKRKK